MFIQKGLDFFFFFCILQITQVEVLVCKTSQDLQEIVLAIMAECCFYAEKSGFLLVNL